jgi:hypothetical protein
MRALNAAQKRMIQAYARDKYNRGFKGIFQSAYASDETLDMLESLEQINDYETLAGDFERHYTDTMVAMTYQEQV